MPFSFLTFEISKWAWQAKILSHTSVTYCTCVFFNVQMMLLTYFDISNQKSIICSAVPEHMLHPVGRKKHSYISISGQYESIMKEKMVKIQ